MVFTKAKVAGVVAAIAVLGVGSGVALRNMSAAHDPVINSPISNNPVVTGRSAKDQLTVASDGSTIIDGYRIPGLIGWERETTPRESPVQSVKFDKTVAGTKIMMKFVLMIKGPKPDTAQDLADAAQRANRISEERGELLLSQATQYQGYPAHLTRTLSRKAGRLTEIQILRVADGKNQFWFTQTLIGPPIAPAARATASEAWRTMTNGFKTAREEQL